MERCSVMSLSRKARHTCFPPRGRVCLRHVSRVTQAGIPGVPEPRRRACRAGRRPGRDDEAEGRGWGDSVFKYDAIMGATNGWGEAGNGGEEMAPVLVTTWGGVARGAGLDRAVGRPRRTPPWRRWEARLAGGREAPRRRGGDCTWAGAAVLRGSVGWGLVLGKLDFLTGRPCWRLTSYKHGHFRLGAGDVVRMEAAVIGSRDAVGR